MIKIGDRVKFINDIGSGTVVKISGSIIEVDVVDGFVVPYMLSDLVVVSEEEEIDVIQRIGVSDERPGTKKGVKREEKAAPIPIKRREPSYARYGKISLVDDDFEDEFLDMHRINEQYRRNKEAAEQREREFEAVRERQETMKQNITESSPVDSAVEPTAIEELSAKIKSDTEKVAPKPKREPKSDDTEVVDLHADSFLETTEGMTNGEIIVAQLARFTIALELCVKSGKRGKIIFIHGVGNGRLKREINLILRSKFPKLTSQDASFREYGYGAIMIFY